MSRKFCVYETYKIDYPQHNYIGKSFVDKVSCSGYKGSGTHLNSAIKKYGKDSFATRILAEFDTESEAYEAEEKLIEEMNPYYNIATGGIGVGSGEKNPMYGKTGELSPNWGLKRSEETRKKISIAASKRVGEKNPFYGKKHTEEHLDKYLRGKNNPMYGRTGELNPMYGISLSGELSWMYGKNHSEETKEKQRLAWTEERKRKQSIKYSGKNNPMFGVVKFTIEKIKRAILREGTAGKAAKFLKCGTTTIHRNLKKHNIKPIYNGPKYSNQSKIIGFEDLN